MSSSKKLLIAGLFFFKADILIQDDLKVPPRHMQALKHFILKYLCVEMPIKSAA